MPQRTTAERLDLPLKILAVLVVAGFLFWLYTTAEPTEVVVEETPEEEPAMDAPIQAIRSNPMFFEDERLRLSAVTVETRLGLHAFWAEQQEEAAEPQEEAAGQQEETEENEAEEAQSILVRVPRSLVDQGVGVGEGQQVWLTGFLHQVNDSVLEAWEGEGVFQDPADRGLVAAEEFFFEVDAIHTSAPGANGEEPQPANRGNEGSPPGD